MHFLSKFYNLLEFYKEWRVAWSDHLSQYWKTSWIGLASYLSKMSFLSGHQGWFDSPRMKNMQHGAPHYQTSSEEWYSSSDVDSVLTQSTDQSASILSQVYQNFARFSLYFTSLTLWSFNSFPLIVGRIGNYAKAVQWVVSIFHQKKNDYVLRSYSKTPLIPDYDPSNQTSFWSDWAVVSEYCSF